MHYNMNVYLIKRYSNRRLYDPQENRTITLDDLIHLIRTGRKVKIVESQTDRDITGRVLAQALVYDLKSWQDGESKIEIMKLLISEGEGAMDFIKKTMLASIGAFEMTRSKVEEIVDTLVEKGEIKKGERSQAVMEMMDKVDENMKNFRARVSEEVESKLKSMRVAKKNDLEQLEGKVDQLIESLAKLEAKLDKPEGGSPGM
ncbi:MAG: hypothetical protein GF404_07865 [candidate division Zixibacteria bacterium]|nr:hypothetical protein [candidate division Zixibacteria bacterium]